MRRFHALYERGGVSQEVVETLTYEIEPGFFLGPHDGAVLISML